MTNAVTLISKAPCQAPSAIWCGQKRASGASENLWTLPERCDNVLETEPRRNPFEHLERDSGGVALAYWPFLNSRMSGYRAPQKKATQANVARSFEVYALRKQPRL